MSLLLSPRGSVLGNIEFLQPWFLQPRGQLARRGFGDCHLQPLPQRSGPRAASLAGWPGGRVAGPLPGKRVAVILKA